MNFSSERKEQIRRQITNMWPQYKVVEEICAGGPGIAYLIRKKNGNSRSDRAILCIYDKEKRTIEQVLKDAFGDTAEYEIVVNDLDTYKHDSMKTKTGETFYLIMTDLEDEQLKEWTGRKEAEEQKALLAMREKEKASLELNAYLGDELQKYQALMYYRSLCQIAPEELKKLVRDGQKYKEAIEKIKAEESGTIFSGLLTWNELNKDSEEAKVIEQGLKQLQEYETIVLETRKSEEARRAAELQVGGIYIFGRYPQTKEGNDRTPIRWKVLAKENGRALLLSEEGLDARKYYTTEYGGITWKDCSLRKWLNQDFIEVAFSGEEQKKIIQVMNENKDNPKYGTAGGDKTEDKAFLLSLEEAKKYFSGDEDRRCKATDYAKLNGAKENKTYKTSWWWLRSPGGSTYDAALVDYGGSLDESGRDVRSVNVVVRPALWVRI